MNRSDARRNAPDYTRRQFLTRTGQTPAGIAANIALTETAHDEDAPLK